MVLGFALRVFALWVGFFWEMLLPGFSVEFGVLWWFGLVWPGLGWLGGFGLFWWIWLGLGGFGVIA